MSELKATYLTGYNRDPKENPGVRHEAGLQEVARVAVMQTLAAIDEGDDE